MAATRAPTDGARAEIAIEVEGLAKAYAGRDALRDLSFGAARGELLAIIGPNGAGKTTLLSILAGITKPDEGRISLPAGGAGWVPQQGALYKRLTVEENLRLFARLEKVADVAGSVDRMLAQADLLDRRHDPVGTLSGGNQQRVNIAIGLLADPAVMLLDEPSTGLDPRQRARLWEFVAALAERGTTVIFSTHHIAEAERYGQRLLVLADGEAIFDGTQAGLRHAVEGAARGEQPGARGAEALSDRRDFESAFVEFLAQKGH